VQRYDAVRLPCDYGRAGCPGSGKSAAAGPLAELLSAQIVLDWDAFMASASALARREIRQSPSTWSAYRQLVRAVLDSVRHLPVVLLGVCTPAELSGWAH
jgi:shikimate kinase